MGRTAKVERKTKETDIKVSLDVDGADKRPLKPACRFSIICSTPLAAMAFLTSKSKPKAISKSTIITQWKTSAWRWGKRSKTRWATSMASAASVRRVVRSTKRLAKVVVDLSGRPYLFYNVKIRPGRVGDFDTDLPHEFFAAFANQLGMNLHIDVPRGENPHHIIEACFKAFARAMDFATQVDPRVQGVLSTKGSL